MVTMPLNVITPPVIADVRRDFATPVPLCQENNMTGDAFENCRFSHGDPLAAGDERGHFHCENPGSLLFAHREANRR